MQYGAGIAEMRLLYKGYRTSSVPQVRMLGVAPNLAMLRHSQTHSVQQGGIAEIVLAVAHNMGP